MGIAAYRVRRLSDGATGYQIMDAASMTVLGLYKDDGTLFGPGDFATTDGGPNNRGITSSLPSWVNAVADPPPPPAPVPQSVSPYQARVALLGAGLLDAVNALMSNPATPPQATIAWEYATIIERYSPFIAALAPSLSLTDAQVDALFIAASQVTDN